MQNMDQLCMGCMSNNNGEPVCSVCGFDQSNYDEPNALKLRTLLAGRYVVGKAVSVNGEGFTYLGFDTATEAVVKITEYFPLGLCERDKDGSVKIGENVSFVFNEGILHFIELNKKLGSLADITALYRVIDIFEINNTAYSVSEYLPGIPLKEFLIRNGGILTWEQVRPLFMPLISAFRALHQSGIVHGGISPETLIVGRDGRVRITDFCIPAIRNAKSEMTAQLFTGFAAIEQYRGEEITPATDVYGFAATMFRTLTGNPPADSKQRIQQDNMTFPKSVAEQMPRSVLVAMANALQIEPNTRTASMEQMRVDLQYVDSADAEANQEAVGSVTGKTATRKYALFAAAATILILGLIALVVYLALFRNPSSDNPASTSIYIPSTVSVGDIGNSSKPESYFSVPDFSGSTVAELLANEEYSKWFEFKVVKKEYNEKIEKGKVCGQSVAVGTAVKKGTAVEITVSLGPSTITIPKKMRGMTKQEAYITLLELGLEPANIEFIEKMDATPTKHEVVLEASPALGEKISPDDKIIVYYNTNIITEESSDAEYNSGTHSGSSEATASYQN